jgi:hypothetical protein
MERVIEYRSVRADGWLETLAVFSFVLAPNSSLKALLIPTLDVDN